MSHLHRTSVSTGQKKFTFLCTQHNKVCCAEDDPKKLCSQCKEAHVAKTPVTLSSRLASHLRTLVPDFKELVAAKGGFVLYRDKDGCTHRHAYHEEGRSLVVYGLQRDASFAPPTRSMRSIAKEALPTVPKPSGTGIPKPRSLASIFKEDV